MSRGSHHETEAEAEARVSGISVVNSMSVDGLRKK